jgi:hypothetical protein
LGEGDVEVEVEVEVGESGKGHALSNAGEWRQTLSVTLMYLNQP